MIHHPPLRKGTQPGRGLTDAGALEEVLARHGAELVLHGHNHVTSATRFEGPNGTVPVVGAPSASAAGGALTHRAGYNLFTIDMTERGPRIAGRARGLLPDGTFADLGELPL
jgi:3',5'-cyclic AMP phosphodiesterase CpdA